MTTHAVPLSDSKVLPAPLGSRGLRTALWAVQGLLALAFAAAGGMKALSPLSELAHKLPWTQDVPATLVRFVGTAEVLAAAGLILPAVTRIAPRLTPLAASALTVVMTLGAGFHIARGEPDGVAVATVLGALAAFVAWGRFRRAPIAPRA